jgi:alkylation response protein AidB-like acyl-CoA dehydrogenase
MGYEFTESQSKWFDATLDFTFEHLAEDCAARDARAEFWREGYERCGKFGLLGLPVPTEYGGQGQNVPTTVAAMEGLGYGCPDAGLAFALSASLWTVTMPILLFGTEEQKRRWLPGLCDGSLFGANAASEPEAGSDIFGMRAKAEKRGEEWVLSGRKIWITGGPVADLYLVFASTEPGKGALGITAFLVSKETPGFHVVRDIPKLGLRTAPMGELAFDDCVLPASALLGRQGRGARIFNFALEYERGAILAPALGTMRRQLDRCIEQARKRKQFGQPIGKFQAVSHRIADMRLRLETCRYMVYGFAQKRAASTDAAMEAAMAKLHVSECYVQNSLDAIRIFGASGYTDELGLERHLRDSVGSVLFSGTNDIQRNIIAQHLRI